MKRGEVSVQIVWCRNGLLNLVFKKNCKIDFVCNPVMNLFPSYISLIRVLNVDIFEVMWNRRLGIVVGYITVLIKRTYTAETFSSLLFL